MPQVNSVVQILTKVGTLLLAVTIGALPRFARSAPSVRGGLRGSKTSSILPG